MVIINIAHNLQNFLKDQNYYIDIFDNTIHVYNYQDLININDKLVELKIEDFKLNIEGEKLVLLKMDKQEIIFKGIINNLRFLR